MNPVMVPMIFISPNSSLSLQMISPESRRAATYNLTLLFKKKRGGGEWKNPCQGSFEFHRTGGLAQSICLLDCLTCRLLLEQVTEHSIWSHKWLQNLSGLPTFHSPDSNQHAELPGPYGAQASTPSGQQLLKILRHEAGCTYLGPRLAALTSDLASSGVWLAQVRKFISGKSQINGKLCPGQPELWGI